MSQDHTAIMKDYLKRQQIVKVKSLDQLKKRRIVPKFINPNDTIDRTWLAFHPSLGKEDAVVWEYESVIDEVKFREIYKIPIVLRKVYQEI